MEIEVTAEQDRFSKTKSICEKLWESQKKLKSLGALIQNQSKCSAYESDEFFGLGQILRDVADDIASVEEFLRTQTAK